jgi:hypothetical protein
LSAASADLECIVRFILAALMLLALAVPLAAAAQAPPGVARGEIVSLAGDTLTLKPADGAPLTIALAKDWTVTLLKPAASSARRRCRRRTAPVDRSRCTCFPRA